MKALLIWSPLDIFEIRGPEVGEFHAQLALGNIELVRSNGAGIRTVVYHPADEEDDTALKDDEQPAVAPSGKSKGEEKSAGNS